MTTAALELTCRDPIVSRDGRPFGRDQGNRMRAVGWPLPSVVAGSLRTAVGKAAGRGAFSSATAQELLQVVVAGAFPVAEKRMYLPAPHDCVIDPEQRPLRVTPQTVEGGCDWPADGLHPVMLSDDQARQEFKPREGPAWWPLDRYAEWLTGEKVAFGPDFLYAPAKEERTHVQLDADSGAADEGNLFTTAALPLTHLRRFAVPEDAPFDKRFAEITLAARVRAEGWCAETAAKLDALHPLGGERRLVRWKATPDDWWVCPKPVGDGLKGKSRVRMILATPAIIRDGWKPGWLNDGLRGSPPDTNVTLHLVGVSIARWKAVSGWSLTNSPGQRPGPKAVRRMVPAGGVYFFETSDNVASLADQWLQPVSDDEQERRDGFGLAVWGTW
jgi:CRISPR-associated protein Cmr3